MGLMWTPPALWNHPADAFDHWKYEHVSKNKSRPHNLKKVEQRVDLGSKIKDSLLPNVVL